MTHRVLAVIPTYNEREHIAQLIQQVCVVLPDVSILVVDDGSPDRTGDVVVAMGRHNPRLWLIQRPTKQGLGSAYRTGFHAALTEPHQYILQLDGDFSHDPRDLPRLLEAAEAGADVVPESAAIVSLQVKSLCEADREEVRHYGNTGGPHCL